MVSKVRNFWLCVFSGVVATTLILLLIKRGHLTNKTEMFVCVKLSCVLLRKVKQIEISVARG